LNIFFIILHFW